MNQTLSVKACADAEVVKAGRLDSTQLNLKGKFIVEHWRNGRRINEYQFPNAVVNQGKNQVLNVNFYSGTQITAWYLGLIASTGYTALALTDTYQDINQAGNGWDEATAYTDGNNANDATTRPVWAAGAASGQATTNASPAVFNITSAGTIKGVFQVGGIVAAATKNDHAASGVLWSTALFTSGDVVVANGDQLKVTYTVTA
jgi:hypothetical protein